METKTCKTCKETKEISLFEKGKGMCRCKLCRNKAQKEYRHRPEYNRDAQRKANKKYHHSELGQERDKRRTALQKKQSRNLENVSIRKKLAQQWDLPGFVIPLEAIELKRKSLLIFRKTKQNEHKNIAQ